jgi:NCAIR mutase (PurE)-related protein
MVDREHIRELLQRVADGRVPVDEALTSLRSMPFEDLGFAKVDHHRSMRTGFAEVVYCEGKAPRQAAEIIASLAKHSAQVLGTRATREHYDAARQRVNDLQYDESARAIWLDRDPDRDRADGVVIVAAGTSDLPVAREAELTLDLLGCRAPVISDVGVAGLHRLLHHVKTLQAATTLIVVAGMEGALPSVVAGLVDVPVIAVPTSVGYGASFHGLTALLAMLNSCATGVGVVNIDNGYGAACLAAMITRCAIGDAQPGGTPS